MSSARANIVRAAKLEANAESRVPDPKEPEDDI